MKLCERNKIEHEEEDVGEESWKKERENEGKIERSENQFKKS